MDTSVYIEKLLDFAMRFGPRLLSALALLVVGLWVIRRFSVAFDALLRKRKVDESLRPFFASMTDIALKVMLLLVVAGTVGLETTSFIAVFSAVAFAIGLALQGSLGNFASGVLILLFRPYKVGDIVTVDGYTGEVAEIQIFNTILHDPELKRFVIPNGKMTEGAIENIVAGVEMQAEVVLLVSSDTSMPLLREAADKVAAQCPWALPGRGGQVEVSGISRDDMKVEIACWINGEHYVETIHYMYEALKKTFDEMGVVLAKERRREYAES